MRVCTTGEVSVDGHQKNRASGTKREKSCGCYGGCSLGDVEKFQTLSLIPGGPHTQL